MEPPDLATIRATVPGILAAERPAAEAVRADLVVLAAYAPTAEWAKTVRDVVDAIEDKLEEWAAATETTDLADLRNRWNSAVEGAGIIIGLGGSQIVEANPSLEECPAATPAQ